MADKPTSVRSLTSAEVDVICSALELAAKSAERFSKGSPNSVISGEYTKQAAICRNLVSHFRNGSLNF